MTRNLNDLADMLYSHKRVETDENTDAGHTSTVYGVAMSDSSNGLVLVKLSNDTTQADEYEGDDETAVELPTVVNVHNGDEVIITLVGGDLKAPFVSGVVGEGDRIAGIAEEAATNALDAVATALDSAHLVITSTAGQLFKNGAESTILQVAVFLSGGGRCDTLDDVRARFGQSARIEWRWRHDSSGTWGTLVSSDPHISHDGMWLTVTPEDVETKTTLEASLVVPD